MKGLTAATRISLSLALLTMTMLLTAQAIGLVPDRAGAIRDGRAAIAETIAVQLTAATREGQLAIARRTAAAIVERNKDVLSIGMRDSDGQLLLATTHHARQWRAERSAQSPDAQWEVPYFQEARQIGAVEVCFRPMATAGPTSWLGPPALRLTLFITLAAALLYLLYLRRVLQYLDPSSVIPGRVKAALDTLSEGVLILDQNERIVLANDAFTRLSGRTSSELAGKRASTLPWQARESGQNPTDPWVEALRHGHTRRSELLSLLVGPDRRTLIVNATPILGSGRQPRGALATFDDVTQVERKNDELRNMLAVLEESRDKVRRQNEQLQFLATRDPLTQCLNRRAFFEQLEKAWSNAKRYRTPLAAIMLDVDHFKSINDTHGHAMGDQVLQQVAQTVQSNLRTGDIMCRYGGEEFCALLPNTSEDKGALVAEKLRIALADARVAGISITATFGVTGSDPEVANANELIDQADRALYCGKRAGRNRVVQWTADLIDAAPPTQPGHPPDSAIEPREVPFSAVMALMSALAHRDSETASHCKRVADLCVAIAQGLMSVADCFLLEVAALLHDIGKIGVPDSILLKPGSLTEEEWKIMDAHGRMGDEIVNAAFGLPELTNIVRNHHAFYGGSARDPGLPTGDAIPIRARILSVADAYDAIVTDRVYRKGRSRAEAFAELRRCAPAQFDPILVERCIERLSTRQGDPPAVTAATVQELSLRIGLEIERLACALDERDISLLGVIAQRLANTALKLGRPRIATEAHALAHAAIDERDLVKAVAATKELLELCRVPVTDPDLNARPAIDSPDRRPMPAQRRDSGG